MLLTDFRLLSLYNSPTTTTVITCLADKLCTFTCNILWRRVLYEYQYKKRERYKYSYTEKKNELNSHSGFRGRSGSSVHRGLDLVRLSSFQAFTIANEPKAPQVPMYEYKQPVKITVHLFIGHQYNRNNKKLDSVWLNSASVNLLLFWPSMTGWQILVYCLLYSRISVVTVLFILTLKIQWINSYNTVNKNVTKEWSNSIQIKLLNSPISPLI